jgi:predicted nucleotidyltransferase
MNALIENQLQQIRDLCYEHQVETLHVFGSVLSEDFSVESDIDILIQFQEMSHEQYAEYYFSLHEKLEQLFGRKVDLLTQRSLSNPYFIAKVERTKKLLYAA